jgi:plasmid stabilization system protein ParE
MKLYDVRVSSEARDDIVQLYQFLIHVDTAAADRALHALEGPRWRELVISFGASGYIALFEIEDDSTVTVTAVRHQREDDYH